VHFYAMSLTSFLVLFITSTQHAQYAAIWSGHPADCVVLKSFIFDHQPASNPLVKVLANAADDLIGYIMSAEQT
jgi:hypothetical protein